jgi:hypothetical protein
MLVAAIAREMLDGSPVLLGVDDRFARVMQKFK